MQFYFRFPCSTLQLHDHHSLHLPGCHAATVWHPTDGSSPTPSDTRPVGVHRTKQCLVTWNPPPYRCAVLPHNKREWLAYGNPRFELRCRSAAPSPRLALRCSRKLKVNTVGRPSILLFYNGCMGQHRAAVQAARAAGICMQDWACRVWPPAGMCSVHAR